jgi:hypothetical protein
MGGALGDEGPGAAAPFARPQGRRCLCTCRPDGTSLIIIRMQVANESRRGLQSIHLYYTRKQIVGGIASCIQYDRSIVLRCLHVLQ